MKVVALVRLARRLALAGAVALAGAQLAAPLAAQDLALSNRAPRFLVTSPLGKSLIEVDASRSALLRQVVSLHVDQPTVRRLLDAIGSQTGIRFGFSRDVLAEERVVQLRADTITVGAALLSILMDTGIDVLLGTGRQVTLVRRVRSAAAPGSIAGRVTDAKTGDPLVGADVVVEGTKLRTASGDKGVYRIAEVEPGEYTVAVRRVGYTKQSRTVTVSSEREAAMDFALAPVVTQLNEIVTTVTGDQRRVEVGHVVGVINADSLTKEAPIQTISQLLQARVPGLVVNQSQGSVGGSVKLQIRGANSILLNNEPIVVLDGVRYASSSVPRNWTASFLSPESTTPLNDLNPNDIESIEVVKGPSAATLYGTDAANGVIVITTKRGRPGPARWNAYMRTARTGIRKTGYPDGFIGVGTDPGGAFTKYCSLANVAYGYCAHQDSIVRVPNPLNDDNLTMFSSQPTYEGGANLSGGRPELRYYFSGNYSDVTGPISMPRAIAELLETRRGEALPEEWRKPNTTNGLNLRSNVVAQLGGKGDVNVSGGYIRNATRSLMLNNPYSGGIAIDASPDKPYGSAQPQDIFSAQSTENVDRFIGQTQGQWRPAAWLVTHASLGLDLGSRDRSALQQNGASEDPNYAPGFASQDRVKEIVTTADIGLTATKRTGRMSFRTSIGSQYNRTLIDGVSALGYGLPPNMTTISSASYVGTGQVHSEQITLGSFIEETFGLNDRLFLTGAFRVDGGSSFGQNYDAVAYPKASASWLLSSEPFMPRIPGLDELRLRYAYGVSGRQPEPGWAKPQYEIRRGFPNDVSGPAIGLVSVGNPNIRPERVREHEFGFDFNGFDSKLRGSLTWYTRRTKDQIVSLPLAAGFGQVFTNLGLTGQHGFELELTAQPIDTRALSVSITGTHSLRRTKLIDAAGVDQSKNPYGNGIVQTQGYSYTTLGFVEGYPLGARFQYRVQYADLNNDGIIVREEVVNPRTLPLDYAGESTPPISKTLNAVIGLFDRHLRISGTLERQSGFYQIDAFSYQYCFFSQCLGAVDIDTPLDEQATIAALGYGYAPLVKGDFTRLREIGVSFDLPVRWAASMRARSASVSLAGRNLALWSKLKGSDPESYTTSSTLGGIPQGRTVTVRLDLGF